MNVTVANVPEAGRPYEAINADKSIFAAMTHAAFLASGMVVQRNAKAASESGSNPDFALFKLIAGKTAPKQWQKLGRIDANGRITVDGLNELDARIKGERRTYNTTLEKVAMVLAAIRTGGTVEVKGAKVKFGAKVTHKVATKATTKATTTTKATKAATTKASASKATTKATKATTKARVLITPASK
jgi:hypothetical protein